MILVKLWGGLGNQMFQFVFSNFLKEKLGQEVIMIYDHKSGKGKHPSINCFDLPIPVSKYKHYSLSSSYFDSFYRVRRKLIQIFPFLSKKIYVEPNFGFDEKLDFDASIFDGYWQSLKYFDKTLDYSTIFKLNHQTFYSVKFEDIIRNMSNSVSLHIRKGDYLKSSVHVDLEMEYYIDSVNYISNLLQSPHFFVFSNDISWAKNNLKIPFNCTYVYEPCQFHDFSDMYLMSLCNHNIIANSTYSWWGAFLNSSNDKVVIAPKSWYCGRINNFTNDLIPDTWIRM